MAQRVAVPFLVAVIGGLGLAPASGAAGTRAPAPSVAVWVYGAHRWSGTGTVARLARLPGGARRLYLSVEEGPRLLTDDPEDARRLGDVLDVLGERLGLRAEAMLLQDPRWTRDVDGAVWRVRRVLAFDARRRAIRRQGFAGLHFDIEPHTEEAWACGDADARRAIVRNLQRVFSQIARLVRRPHGTRLAITAALPWWLGQVSVEVPEAAPARWLADLDEVVLMAYGDPGGPLVGESALAVLRRVDDTRLWRGLPPGRGLRIGLATYEYANATALTAAIQELSATLGHRAGFRGVAIFAHGQPFHAPLVGLLAGQVLDASRHPIPEARIHSGRHEARSNRCGLFTMRNLPAPTAELTIEAPGFQPARLTVSRLVPGRQKALEPIVLERRP